MINSTGRHYDFVIGPRQGRTDSKEQYAFIYDAATVEVDRTSLYSIDDRGDYFQRPPFVASFRIRGPPPDQAFTFTLIDIHTEPAERGRKSMRWRKFTKPCAMLLAMNWAAAKTTLFCWAI